MAQNSSAPRSQEDYITHVSEEIGGKVTKRLSKVFSRTKNRILGALAHLADFLMNPLLQGHSGTTPEPARNALSTSQGTNENDSQNDPLPEAGLFHGQMTQTLAQKMVTTKGPTKSLFIVTLMFTILAQVGQVQQTNQELDLQRGAPRGKIPGFLLKKCVSGLRENLHQKCVPFQYSDDCLSFHQLR